MVSLAVHPKHRPSEQLITDREKKGQARVVSTVVIPALRQEDCHEFNASLAMPCDSLG